MVLQNELGNNDSYDGDSATNHPMIGSVQYALINQPISDLPKNQLPEKEISDERQNNASKGKLH